MYVLSLLIFPLDIQHQCSSDAFSVPFVGTCVSGTILSGRVKIGDAILLGPDAANGWLNTSIKSIQRKRVNVNTAEAGQSVSFALKRIRRNQVRKGNSFHCSYGEMVELREC